MSIVNLKLNLVIILLFAIIDCVYREHKKRANREYGTTHFPFLVSCL